MKSIRINWNQIESVEINWRFGVKLIPGIINIEEINRNNYKTAWADVRADAGIGFTYTHRNWGPLETISPLVIRLDLPLFLNRPPYGEEYTQMRWILGIGKTF